MRIFVLPLVASLALAGCAKGQVEPPAIDLSKVDVGAIVKRASDLAVLGCHVRPALETIGPLVASAISTALGFGPAPGFTVDALAQAGARSFCAFVDAATASGAAPTVGRARGAAVNYGTTTVNGRPVAIIGTPE